jgi:uncharacterized membrane protein (DUF485 family)
MVHVEHQSHIETLDPVLAARNSRIGLFLFALYSALYLTFVLLNAFAPRVMEIIVFAGMNLAVAFGLGLIVAAFLLALLYAWLCRTGAKL